MGRICVMRHCSSHPIPCEPGATLCANFTRGPKTKRWNSVSSPFSRRSTERSPSHRARSDQGLYLHARGYKLTGLGRNLKKLILWRCVGKAMLTCNMSSSTVVDDPRLSQQHTVSSAPNDQQLQQLEVSFAVSWCSMAQLRPHS